MTPVTIVGLVAGSIFVAVAAFVFVSKKAFPAGGIAVSAIGLVLIGMSQWTQVKVVAGGVTIELQALKADIQKTAAAAEVVAVQAQHAADSVHQVKQQLADVTRLLDASHVVPAPRTQEIRDRLSQAPTVDRSQLDSARASLRQLMRR